MTEIGWVGRTGGGGRGSKKQEVGRARGARRSEERERRVKDDDQLALRGTSEARCGLGVALLSGPPGVGKTHAMRLIASATGTRAWVVSASKLVDNMDACEEVTKRIQSMDDLYMIDEAEVLFPVQKRTAALPVCDGEASPQGLATFPGSHRLAAIDAAPPRAHGGLGRESARPHGPRAQESHLRRGRLRIALEGTREGLKEQARTS